MMILNFPKLSIPFEKEMLRIEKECKQKKKRVIKKYERELLIAGKKGKNQ